MHGVLRAAMAKTIKTPFADGQNTQCALRERVLRAAE